MQQSWLLNILMKSELIVFDPSIELYKGKGDSFHSPSVFFWAAVNTRSSKTNVNADLGGIDRCTHVLVVSTSR